MPIDSSIALQGRPPQIMTPMESMQHAVSIADMLAQVRERQQLVQQRAAEAPLRAAAQAAELGKLNDAALVKKALDLTVKWNPETQDLDYDDQGAADLFQQHQAPYLMETYLSQKHAHLAGQRTEALQQADQRSKLLEVLATPSENFKALAPDKKAAAWPDLRVNLVTANRALGKVLPYKYDPTVVDPQLEQIIQSRDETLDGKQKLEQAQKKEQFKQLTPAGQQELMAQDLLAIAKATGTPVDKLDQEIVHGVIEKRMGVKIDRSQLPSFEVKPGTVNGSPFNANFNPKTGKYTDPTTGADISATFKPKPETVSVDQQELASFLKGEAGPTATSFSKTPAGYAQWKASLAPAQQLPVVIQTDKGPQLVNRSTGTASAITSNDGTQVQPMPTADTRNRAVAFQKAGPIIDHMSELSEKINTSSGLLAKITGAAEKAAAKVNYDDDVAEYESLISGFTPLVARAVGHVGVLTEQDVQSVKALFPKPGDSKSLRDRKVKQIKTIMSEIGATGGAPPAGGSPGPEKIIEYDAKGNRK